MTVTWVTTGDLDEFVAAAGGFLRARPVENTILLTTLDHLRKRGLRAFGDADPRMGWWRSAGGVVESAFLQTPPYPVVLADVPQEAIASLVPVLAAGRPTDTVEINAGRDVAHAIAAQWLAQTAVALRVCQEVRLHRLVTLTPPDPIPPGRARVAQPADRDVLMLWWDTFVREVNEIPGDPAAAVDDRIGYGGLTVWELDSVLVSMAGRSRVTAATVRIGPVFTPVPLRQHGYAAAVTAAISRSAQALAGEVVLFTDLANPTSNALYERLGYQPVEDRVKLRADSSA